LFGHDYDIRYPFISAQDAFNSMRQGKNAWLPSQQASLAGLGGLQNNTVVQNNALKEKEEMFSIYGQVKEFIKNHRDIIFTIIAIALADKYLLNGALRSRLTKLVEAILSRAEAIVAPKTPEVK